MDVFGSMEIKLLLKNNIFFYIYIFMSYISLFSLKSFDFLFIYLKILFSFIIICFGIVLWSLFEKEVKHTQLKRSTHG